MERIGFNYSRLRGRIVEKCGNIETFAKLIDITPTAAGRKLSEKSSWTQDEIIKACNVLDIPANDITEYFFCRAS